MERIIILDVSCSAWSRSIMCQLGLKLIDAEEMTREIIQSGFWNSFNPEKTLLVFPGNGAIIVRGFVSKDWLESWQWVSVHAKRYWQPGEDPWVEAERIFPDKMILGLKDIVVIDDVVSSGKTTQLLRSKNIPWLPGARWHLVTWVAQQSAKTSGFVKVFAVVKTGENNKKTPINSLSTLISDKAIAKSYISRIWSQPNAREEFQRVLDETTALN